MVPKGVTRSLRADASRTMRPRGQFKRGPSHPMTTVQY